LTVLSALPAQDTFTFSGYTKNLASVVHLRQQSSVWNNLLHNRASFEWHPDSAWTIRTDLRSRVFIGDQVQTPQFESLTDMAANDVVDLSIGTSIGNDVYAHTYLDRCFVRYTGKGLEVHAGRQRINWGINTLWNPNDIFNAYAFTDFDYEERPGSDALSIRYFTSPLSSIELVGKLGNKMREGAIAALWRTNLKSYDLQLLSGYLTRSQNVVVGGGWAGNLKNWGFKGEGSVFIPVSSDDKVAASVSTGVDYIFPNGLLIGFGGLYNALGRTSGGLDDLFGFELSARNLYPFRWTVNANAAFAVHPLVNVSLTTVYSVATSHPVFVTPAITWSALSDIDVDLVGQFVLHREGKDYVSPVQAGFLRIKWSY
jgi:hypothetical protein